MIDNNVGFVTVHLYDKNLQNLLCCKHLAPFTKPFKLVLRCLLVVLVSLSERTEAARRLRHDSKPSEVVTVVAVNIWNGKLSLWLEGVTYWCVCELPAAGIGIGNVCHTFSTLTQLSYTPHLNVAILYHPICKCYKMKTFYLHFVFLIITHMSPEMDLM